MKRKIKIALLCLLSGGVIAGLVLLLVAQAKRPLFSPPDKAREWARQEYEKFFVNGPPSGGLPTLSATAPLKIAVTREPGKVRVETEGPSGISTDPFFELFDADDAGEVVLPGGNRMRLDGVAIVMPEDVAGGDDPIGGMSDLTWLDPKTLDRLPKEKIKGWETRKWSKGESPKLFFRVSNEGGKPIRWLAANAFDDRTLIQAQSGSSYHTHAKDGQFGMDLDIWHQAPLRIAVNFSFGDAELRDLELKPGTEVQFGDEALVRVVEVAAVPFDSTGWHTEVDGRIEKRQTTFGYSRNRKPRENHGRSVVFHAWPAHNEKMIDFEIEETDGAGQKSYVNAWGSDGITDGEFPRESKLVAVKARRMPRLGRAVFLLPKIPRLPEVDNLFDTPIARAELRFGHHTEELIREGAAVQWKVGHERGIPNSHFPMTLEDTTPAEILRLNEKLAGRPLFLNRKKLEVSTVESGRLVELKAWWQTNKPNWLP